MTINRTRLREGLVQCYSLSELETLCADIGVDYDVLPGEDKVSKSRELVDYLNRRGQLAKLLEYCRADRPNYAWDAVDPPAAGLTATPPGQAVSQRILDKDWQAEFNLRFLKAAVVWITVEPQQTSCCGFVVEPRGYVVTFDFGQYRNASKITITWNGQDYVGRWVKSDTDAMVALLSLAGSSGQLFPAIQLGAIDPVKPGDTIYLMGYDTRAWLNSAGRVTATGAMLREYKIPVILADIDTRMGYAGAPVINQNGHVIGVHFVRDPQRGAALIPVEYVHRLLISHM